MIQLNSTIIYTLPIYGEGINVISTNLVHEHKAFVYWRYLRNVMSDIHNQSSFSVHLIAEKCKRLSIYTYSLDEQVNLNHYIVYKYHL